MKYQLAVCLIALIGAACAAPQGGKDDDVKVVSFTNNNNGVDGYNFAFEQSDGQIRAEVGELKDVTDAEGQTTKALVVTGAYSFIGPDGQTYWVTFTADENGFHPVIGTGLEGGPKPGGDYGINPNALKSLIG